MWHCFLPNSSLTMGDIQSMIQSIIVAVLVLLSAGGILIWVSSQSKTGSKIGCSGHCSSCSTTTRKAVHETDKK